MSSKPKTILLFIVLFFIAFSADAQKRDASFKILDARVLEEDNRVQVSIRLKDSDRKGIVNKKELYASEELDGEKYKLEVDRFFGSIDGVGKDTFSILILVDVSGSMRTDNRLVNAKEAVRQLIIEEIGKIRCTCNFFISTFDNTISPDKAIDKDNVVDVLKGIRLGNDTDLYRALEEKISSFKSQPGKKVLILLSDGVDDTKNNPYYRNHDRLTAKDVFQKARGLKEKDFLVFPISLGDKTDEAFLKRVVDQTPTGEDYHIASTDASELSDIFFNLIRESITDYRILLYPKEGKCNYKGAKRDLFLTWKPGGEQPIDYKAGSDQNPVEACWNKAEKDSWFWLWIWIIGILIVSGLLGLLYFGVPRWKRRAFTVQFVKRYSAKIGGNQKRDPVTQLAYKDGDPVVVKCQTVTSLSTWEHIGHCPNYPNCREFAKPCSGSGAPDVGGPNDKSTFWSQKGIYKPLNWLWFGSLGGLIAWFMFAIMQLFFTDAIVDWLTTTFAQGDVHDYLMTLQNGDDLLKNIETLAEDILVGIFIGTSLSVTLSIVEERGNGAGVSWPRVILRGFIGSLVCALVFFIGFVAQYLILGSPYLSGILIWLFFGVAIGLILSIKTTIDAKRGIIAGVLASIFAYQIYALISWTVTNFELARLLGFIIFGAILGYILAQVLIALEDFKLQLLKPNPGVEYPISKRLRHNRDVVIGTGVVDIRVKWDHAALPGHLRLLYENFNVIVEPKGETMINDRIITREEKYVLKNNDRIKLGKRSNSEFLFIVTESYEQKGRWAFWHRILGRK